MFIATATRSADLGNLPDVVITTVAGKYGITGDPKTARAQLARLMQDSTYPALEPIYADLKALAEQHAAGHLVWIAD